MLVEVSGPSGAGKTVLAWKIMEALEASGISIAGVHERPNHPIGGLSSLIANSGRHNIWTDIYLLPWTFMFMARNPRFTWFSIKQISNRNGADVPKLDVFRAFFRKCGLFEYVSRKKFRSVVIVIDEGLFHCAQIYMVHPDERVSTETLEEFARLVPLPDQLIIINADVETLHHRSMARTDFYPATYSNERRRGFSEHGRQAFSDLSKLKRIQSVVRLVSDTNEVVVRQAVDEIEKCISKQQAIPE